MKKYTVAILVTFGSMMFAQSAMANNCQDMMKQFIKKSETKPVKPVVTKKEITKPVVVKEEVKPIVKETAKPVKVETPKVKYEYVNVKAKLDSRLEYGDISKKDYSLFLSVTDDFEKKNKAPLMGEGMNKCFDEFSSEAAESMVKLVNSTKGAKNSSETFDRLVKGSQDIFGDSKAAAKTKICALSRGNNCKLFSEAIARHCK